MNTKRNYSDWRKVRLGDPFHLGRWREGQAYKVVLMVITAGKAMVSNDAAMAGHLLRPGSRSRSASPNSMQPSQAQEDGGRDWSDAYTS